MPKSPLQRKLSYVDDWASIDGINLSMLNWAAFIDQIMLQLGIDVLFRLWLDLFLNLNLQFEFDKFDWHDLDFKFEFEPEFTDKPKARYGLSKYGRCYYDPTNATSKNLERMVWAWRHKTTDKNTHTWKSADLTLKKLIAQDKDPLHAKGVKQEYLDHIEEILALIEGKMFHNAFAGFSVVGYTKVPEIKEDIQVLPVRQGANWVEHTKCDSVAIYECHVGLSRVGWARPIGKIGSLDMKVKKSLSDHLKQTVDDFRARNGFVEEKRGIDFPYAYAPYVGPPSVKTLHPRPFHLARVDQMHYEGGKHQILLQSMINATKEILNREGVIANFRMPYINFIQELSYLKYDPHTYWKRYRQMFTEDEIVNKYINMGCDESIIHKVKGVVK